MYIITFLNYNYFGGDETFLNAGKKTFDSFVALINYCKNNKLYLMSDKHYIMCGTRHVILPSHIRW